MRFSGLLFFILVGVLSISCTREVEEKTNLTLSFPQFKTASSGGTSLAASGTQITFINVTVSGPDFGPEVWTWDAHTECLTCSHNNLPAAPTSHTFRNLPSGTKLIQVLVVPGGDGNNDVYYGDVEQNLAPGDQSVPISVSNIGSTGLEGNVAGRYYVSTVNTPTMKLRAFAHPVVNGVARPKMAMWTSDVIAGWFNLFFLEGFKVSYEKMNGEVIFPAKTILEMQAEANTDSVAVWGSPPFYTSHTSTENPTGLKSKRVTIMGFYGNPGSRYACEGPGGNYFSSYSFSDIYGLNLLGYSTYNDSASPYTAGPINVTASVGFCSTAANSYNTVLYYRPGYWNNEGRSIGISGPFRYLTNTGEGDYVLREDAAGLHTSPSTVKSILTYQFLPGTGSEIDGVEIFARGGYLESGGGGPNSIDCSRLASQDFFQVATESWSATPITTTITGATMASLGKSPFALPFMNYVICPYKNFPAPIGTVYYKPVVSKNTRLDGGSSGPEPTWYPVLIPDTFDDSFADSTSCRKYWVELVSPIGASYAPPSALSLYFNNYSSGGFTLNAYSDVTCSSALGGTITGVSTSATPFWVKGAGSGQTLLSFQIAATSSSSNSVRSNYGYVGYDDGGIVGGLTQLTVYAQSTLFRGKCDLVFIIRGAAAGALTLDTTDESPVNLSTTGNGKYFLDSQCEGNPVTTVDFDSNTPYKALFYRAVSASGSETLNVTGASVSGTSSALSLEPEVPDNFSYSGSSIINSCYRIEFKVMNANGYEVNFKKIQDLRLTVDNTSSAFPVKVYADHSSCFSNTSAGDSYLGSVATGGTGQFNFESPYYTSSIPIYLRADGGATTDTTLTLDVLPLSLTISGATAPLDVSTTVDP